MLRSRTRLRAGGGSTFSPTSLFAASEVGAHLVSLTPTDNASSLTMYEEATGITLVAAVERPQGLWLDSKQSAARGSELVTNGGFSADSNWTKVGGSTISAGVATLPASSSVAQSGVVSTSAGSFYEITFDQVITAGAGGVIVYCGTTSSADARYAASQTGSGSKRVILQAGGVNTNIQFGMNGTTAATLDNVSVKLIAGHHAVQATSAARPTTKADQNIAFDGFDDAMAAVGGGGGTAGFLLCAAITVSGGAGAARTIWSDTGTNTGYRVRVNTSNQLELAAGNGTTYTTIATTATLPAGETHVVTAWDDGTNLNVQIDSGDIASTARPTVSAGTASWTIGKDNGAATSPFNGRMYSMTYRQTDCGDTLRASLKSYHAGRAGVTL
jgi:hypothetical protein